MESKVFVVTYGGTPMKVCWDVNSATEFIQDMESGDDIENYFIHETLLEDLNTWIRDGMTKAEGKPVPPNYNDALDWMVSEVGEAVGARVASKDAWVRNHPEKHTQDSVDKEIAQAIMMGVLALGQSPFNFIKQQLEKWGYRDAEFVDDREDYYQMLFNFPRGEK